MKHSKELRTINGDYTFTTKADAVNIVEIKGSLIIPNGRKAAFPKLTSVGGSIYASGADTKTAFPKLTSVGGYIYASGAEHVRTIGIAQARRVHFEAVLSFGYLFTDGLLARIDGKARRAGELDVYRVVLCGQTKQSFVVVRRSDMVSAHGDTLAEAKADLLFKMADRPLDAFKGLDPDKKLDFAEGVSLYRAVTGACLAGCRAWVEQNGISKAKKYSLNDILALTKGAYNNEALVKWAKNLK